MCLICGKCDDWNQGQDADGKAHRLGDKFGTCKFRTEQARSGRMDRIRPRYTTHQDDPCRFGRKP